MVHKYSKEPMGQMDVLPVPQAVRIPSAFYSIGNLRAIPMVKFEGGKERICALTIELSGVYMGLHLRYCIFACS